MSLVAELERPAILQQCSIGVKPHHKPHHYSTLHSSQSSLCWTCDPQYSPTDPLTHTFTFISSYVAHQSARMARTNRFLTFDVPLPLYFALPTHFPPRSPIRQTTTHSSRFLSLQFYPSSYQTLFYLPQNGSRNFHTRIWAGRRPCSDASDTRMTIHSPCYVPRMMTRNDLE